MSVNTDSFHRAVLGGLNDALAAYGQQHGLPRLSWGPSSRVDLDANPSRSDLPDEEHEAAAVAWAEHLGLDEDVHEPRSNMRSWSGTVGWMTVEVWAVLDWDAFGQRTAGLDYANAVIERNT